jgi:O-succinylbenzoic acid--CoA ligase
VRTLLALDLALGPDLAATLRRCADEGQAFCLLDQRLSPRRRLEQLEFLGATDVLDPSGRTPLARGQGVEPDVGLVMLTSGSSGPAKAAQLSWNALRASAEITQATLRGDSAPAWYPCLPACHIGGLAVLLRAILSDATLVWGGEDQLDDAPSRGATHVAVVRTQLARHDLSGFATVLLGGGRPPTPRPDNVVTTWGMTETGSGIVYDGYALAGVDVASVDGELIVRTPTLFSAYRDAPRPQVTGPDGRQDWFPTGDAGDVVEGRVSVRGRLGFVISTGGEKLWPEDLEGVLATIDGVRDVAVTGVDDPEWGQRVVALVVSDGSRLDDAIAAAADERIGPWAKPKEIRYVAAIPRTGNGKIRRSELVNLF